MMAMSLLAIDAVGMGIQSENTVYAMAENQSVIDEYERIYNVYFNKRMDEYRINTLYDTCEKLSAEYYKNGDTDKAIDALMRQMKYAEYKGEDFQKIYDKISELQAMPSLYVFSTKAEDMINNSNYMGEKWEYHNNTKYIGVRNNSPFTDTTLQNNILTVDVDFYTENIFTVITNEIGNYDFSSIVINWNVKSNTTELLASINNGDYDTYIAQNLEHLNYLNTVLGKKIFLNWNVDYLVGVDPEVFKATYVHMANLRNSKSPNVAIIYTFIEDPLYFPDASTFNWVGMRVNIDNDNSDIVDIISKRIQKDSYNYDKPIMITDLKVNYVDTEENISIDEFTKNQLEIMNNNMNFFAPQIKGIIYNNANGEITNNAQYIQDTYFTQANMEKHGIYVHSDVYNHNSEVMELKFDCELLEDENSYITFDLNGVRVAEGNKNTFSYTLYSSNLNIGDNKLVATVKGSDYQKVNEYNINKSESNQITIKFLNDVEKTSTNSDFVKPSSYQLDVKNIMQYPELPTGCEVTALTTLLNYLDYNVSKTTMAKDFMPRGAIGTTHPDVAFIGNPEVRSAYGCNAPVIVETANKYFASVGSKHKAYNITGASYDKLTEYVAKGYPVLVWETMYMAKSYPTTRWVINGQTIYWQANLHCVVLTGYTDSTYTIADPLEGIKTHSRSLIETRYNELGKQAIIITDEDLDLI